MSHWREIACRQAVTAEASGGAQAPEPAADAPPPGVLGVLGVLGTGGTPDRKRPAMGKPERGASLSTVDIEARPRAPRIALDGEGLPFTACAGCGGGDFWKPARLPLEGEGWRCIACDPPEPDRWRHAVSVPVTVRP